MPVEMENRLKPGCTTYSNWYRIPLTLVFRGDLFIAKQNMNFPGHNGLFLAMQQVLGVDFELQDFGLYNQ